MGDDKQQKTRALILARRAKFMAATLASVAATTAAVGATTEACGGDTNDPVPISNDAGKADAANPQPCLSIAVDAGPEPCLAPLPPDGGEDAGEDGGDGGKDGGKDASPQPCLIAPLDGGGANE